MALKGVLENLEAVAEPMREFYAKGQDGKFYLQADGYVPKEKLDEFRDNNVAMKKELEKFKDIDPEQYKKLVEEHKKLNEKKLLDAGEVDKVVEERVKTLRGDFETKMAEAAQANSALSSRLAEVLIDSSVKTMAMSANVLPTAMEDVVLRAKTIFRVENGEVVAKNGSGQQLYDVDGTTPLSIEGWLKGLKNTASHLFTAPAGGGARGNLGRDGKPVPKTAVEKIAAGLAQQR